MKFMQRGKDMEAEERLKAEEKKLDSELHWILDIDRDELLPKKPVAEEDQSYMQFMDINPLGRRSFKGFNKDIETLSSQTDDSRKRKSEDVAVSDTEMAAVMGNKGTKTAAQARNRKQTTGGEPLPKAKKLRRDADAPVAKEEAPTVELGTSSRFKFLKPV
ncbi:M-phase phosphoprotein 6 [Phlyctochytrium bullatum]|nr:M-phase phosphoprotein 6 [Phlyctochytrium bullatum]